MVSVKYLPPSNISVDGPPNSICNVQSTAHVFNAYTSQTEEARR